MEIKLNVACGFVSFVRLREKQQLYSFYFLFFSLMYFNSKLTGTAQKTGNNNNTLACRTAQKSVGTGWNLLYDKNATSTI